MSDFVRIGDTILARVGKRIEECEVVGISPSGKHIQIDNENWDEQWIRLLDYLETLEAIDEVEIEQTDDDDDYDIDGRPNIEVMSPDSILAYDLRNKRK